ncbi:MAG: prolyl oligopeptidase family serine peptidase [Kiritimatiellae bacterium]|nr:prolyl oligopeptidase family serine peptidase [Kiritimatiellia bacterium]
MEKAFSRKLFVKAILAASCAALPCIGVVAQDKDGAKQKKQKSAKKESSWDAKLVEVKSSADGTMQPCWYWAPGKAAETAVPLIVGLHTWSYDYKSVKSYSAALNEAKRRGWAFVGPNFRGPNSTPAGCGSELAVQDIEDAVEYAKKNCKIDADRVYIVGGSGGGHMTLLMLGSRPGLFAAGSAFCPITDLARWHADSLLKHPGRGKGYAKMMESACGGTPAERAEEYAKRSPLTWLHAAKAAKTPVYIATGIHDGWTGSVPVGHAIRAFNALCEKGAEVSEAHIAAIEEKRAIPSDLESENVKDPFYNQKKHIHFRRTSGNVRLTLFEGGHSGNFPAGVDFMSRQRRGAPVDWALPSKAKGGVENLTR